MTGDTYTYCGCWQPTAYCRTHGYCDYHAGVMSRPTAPTRPFGPPPTPDEERGDRCR